MGLWLNKVLTLAVLVPRLSSLLVPLLSTPVREASTTSEGVWIASRIERAAASNICASPSALTLPVPLLMFPLLPMPVLEVPRLQVMWRHKGNHIAVATARTAGAAAAAASVTAACYCRGCQSCWCCWCQFHRCWSRCRQRRVLMLLPLHMVTAIERQHHRCRRCCRAANAGAGAASVTAPAAVVKDPTERSVKPSCASVSSARALCSDASRPHCMHCTAASSPSLSSCRSVAEKAWACASTFVLKAATDCATTSVVPLAVSCRTATMSATSVVTSEERLEPQNHVHNALDIVHDRRQQRRAPPRVRQGLDLGDGGGQAHEHRTLDGGQSVVNQPLLNPRDLLHAVQKRTRSTRLSPQHADPPALALGPMGRGQNTTPPPTN